MAKSIIFLFLIAILIPDNIEALTDAEWQELKRSSSLFKFADDKLTISWKKTYEKITDQQQKQYILQNQKDWIARGRDEAAQAYMKQGLSYENAYTKSTLDRVKFIENFITSTDTKQYDTQFNQKTSNNNGPQYSNAQSAQTKYSSDKPINSVNSAGRIGPILCGFQLGMSRQEAIANAKNLNFPVVQYMDSSFYYNYKDNLHIFFIVDKKTDRLISITLSDDMFNVPKVDANGFEFGVRQFAQLFAYHLKINLFQKNEGNNWWIQNNPSETNEKYLIKIQSQLMHKCSEVELSLAM